VSQALRAFLYGTALRIEASIQDFDSTPTNLIMIDVDSNTVQIYDDQANLVNTIETGSIIHDGLGEYHVDFQLPSGVIGKWKAVWTATKGSLNSLGAVDFNVVPVAPVTP